MKRTTMRTFMLVGLVLLSAVLAACTTVTVSITSPADGSVFNAWVGITFSGTAVDGFGNTLTGESLAWTSDRDGAIGSGTTFTKADLSAGVHTITLTATAAGGTTTLSARFVHHSLEHYLEQLHALADLQRRAFGADTWTGTR